MQTLPGVGDDATVLFDSGVRRGADALVALALAGEDGVCEHCRNFLADLDRSYLREAR